MQRINLAWFSQLALRLQPLTLGGLEETASGVKNLTEAWHYLSVLGDVNATPLALDASRPIIWQILELSGRVFGASPNDEKEALESVKDEIRELATKLGTLIDADLAHQPVYQIQPKRAYDVDKLIGDATTIFSAEVRAAFTDEEQFNVVEAGKCLAYEVSTAAAFHFFRAIDSMMRRYCIEVNGALPKNNNWGEAIKALESGGVDAKITGILRQVKDFHRNPTIHPEARLSVDEALSLVGVAESAISAMIGDIKARQSAKALASVPLIGDAVSLI